MSQIDPSSRFNQFRAWASELQGHEDLQGWSQEEIARVLEGAYDDPLGPKTDEEWDDFATALPWVLRHPDWDEPANALAGSIAAYLWRGQWERRQPPSMDYWKEVGIATGQLRGCAMAPLGCLVYFGGLVLLVAWGNGILILLLWMFLGGPIVVGLVSLSVAFLVLPFAMILMGLAKVFKWGQDN